MLASYLHMVRRRWYVIPAVLAAAILILVLALHLSVTVTSRVVVPFPGSLNDQNFQGVASSDAVAKAVIHDLKLHHVSPESLLNQVSVSQEYGTNIYDITVRDASKARATAVCDTWVKETITLYTRLNTAPATQAVLAAQQQLGDTTKEIADLQGRITAFEYAHPELVNTQISSSSSNSTHNSGSSSGSVTSTTNGSTSTSTSTTSSGTPATGGTSSNQQGGGSSSATTNNRSGSSSTSDASSRATSVTTTNNTPGSVGDAQTLADLKVQLADAQAIYNQLVSEATNVQASNLGSLQKAYAQVLDPASVPPVNVPLLAAFTVLLSLLVGGGLILALEYADHSIRGRGTLDDTFGPAQVLVVSSRPSRRERRHVAASAWALPAPGEMQRPGQWATLLSVAALTAGATAMQSNGHVAAGMPARRDQDLHNGALGSATPEDQH